MFEFGIIECANGIEVIDPTIKTPFASLTPTEMMEYTELESSLYAFEIKRQKRRREKKRENIITKIRRIFR